MKYVISQHDDVVMFSESINHSEMKKVVHGEIVSAGFVDAYPDAKGQVCVRCYGKSVTLGNLASRSEDAGIIKRKIVNPY